MARIVTTEYGDVKIWLSARDTYYWADGQLAERLGPDAVPGSQYGRWPGSELSGKSLFAEFDKRGNLVEVAINGGRGEQDVSGSEFSAITSDFLRAKYGPEHPAIR